VEASNEGVDLRFDTEVHFVKSEPLYVLSLVVVAYGDVLAVIFEV